MSDVFFEASTTSNYTTPPPCSGGKSLENRKRLLPVKPGERGLRQSDAVFHHVRQLPEVLGPVLEELKETPQAIGVSVSPTTEEDSYMPCFLVGKTTAELLGKAWGVPVEHFSHQQGAHRRRPLFRRQAGAAGAPLLGLSRLRRHHRGAAGPAGRGGHAPHHLGRPLPGAALPEVRAGSVRRELRGQPAGPDGAVRPRAGEGAGPHCPKERPRLVRPGGAGGADRGAGRRPAGAGGAVRPSQGGDWPGGAAGQEQRRLGGPAAALPHRRTAGVVWAGGAGTAGFSPW